MVETEHEIRLEVRDLPRRAAVERLEPDVADVTPIVDVGDSPPDRFPPISAQVLTLGEIEKSFDGRPPSSARTQMLNPQPTGRH